MKLHKTRAHYYSTNNGRTWIPKKSYEFEELKYLKINGKRQSSYFCDVCEKYHTGRIGGSQ